MPREMELNNLIEEAQQLLGSVAELLTSTMQQGVEAIKNYEELASDKIAAITKAKKDQLAEYAKSGGAVKSCVEKRQIEFQRIEEKLRKELASCYAKNYGNLDSILSDKAAIREEAEKIKNELQQTIANCMSAETKTQCFMVALDSLKKRIKVLSSRLTETAKKEANARVKASKALYDCDKKATDEAYAKCTAIINDIKKCTDQQK
ncbi:uncharacterized protein LOC105690861 [Athalia rosae]|uniref:uncharacterized protein LOC105690861 n=1 Tax=Athalia rosae TaxID=37344 RepID=UPI00203364BD|nr:uncharacterized protein LOC105690861 [Athalia rosae]